MSFLPVTLEELYEQGVEAPDFIMVSGDAYVDHPSFGHALIARMFHRAGFSVAVLPQPVTDSDYTKLGEPRLGFLVCGGVVDSMVNNYTVALNRRREDEYSEGGQALKRPDRTVTVYCKALKRLYPSTAILAGGIEASLRRFAHYDYWSDTVMPSILIDAPMDILVYGMGENPVLDIINELKKGVPLGKIKGVRGTAYLTDLANAPKSVQSVVSGEQSDKYTLLSSFERVRTDKKIYAKSFMTAYENTDPFYAKGLIQKHGFDSFVVAEPPSMPIKEKDLDDVYQMEFMRNPHPMYLKGVPAIEEVKFSVTAHRGCFGNCTFCALTFHQGKLICKRSEDSIIQEVQRLASDADFKGYIHDIGGPSANFHNSSCEKSEKYGACKDRECVGAGGLCKNLKVDHSEYLRILRRARSIQGVKKVFIRSGIRFDYLMADKDKSFFNELVQHHISGQLKVAPEHISKDALNAMNKPCHEEYVRFASEYERLNKNYKKDQYLVPYFISSHPGSTLSDAASLTEYLLSIGYMPKQVQDFYPTPSTLATTMYYTGLDPRTLKPIYCAKTAEEKAMQRALLQYRLPKNKQLIEKALKLAKREDLYRIICQKYFFTGSKNDKQAFYASNKTHTDKSVKQRYNKGKKH